MLSEISIGLTRNPTIHLHHCLANARERSNADFFQSDLQFLARTRSQKPLVIAIYRPVKNAIWNLTSAFAKGLPPMTLTRVVLADDNEELLADICQELENEFRIVATVTNGREASTLSSALTQMSLYWTSPCLVWTRFRPHREFVRTTPERTF